MTKTAQQKRFETAWQIIWPNDEPRIFDQDTKGNYTWPEVQDTFEGWQLRELLPAIRDGNATTGGENEK